MKVFHGLSRSNASRCLAAFALVLAACSASAQTVDIATVPLYVGADADPNVVISASFEFPTAGQAYIGVSYSASSVYVGYFDSRKCYSYSGNTSFEDPDGYFFVPSGSLGIPVSNQCNDFNAPFYGNLMNWATMSALDEFRYALTGGNRDREIGNNAQSPSNGTVIQRAYLTGCSPTTTSDAKCPGGLNGSAVPGVPDFYNSGDESLFPRLQTTFGGQPVFINNCKTFVYLSGSATDGNGNPGNCTRPRKDLGIYNVRVSVCDSAEGPVRTGLCLQYGGANGKYKPVGPVQRNAESMRFAIFGYLLDRTVPGYTVPLSCQDGFGGSWNRCRVGGVLRSPMKYLGPTTYSASGVGSPNGKREINTDGTLVDDPEGNAANFGGRYSGFINYLNRFGSAVQAGNGTGGAGEYKRYDTMGEMYYEAIRYYQNLQPTPETYESTQNVAYNNQVRGYFPVLSSATKPPDPILAQCAANYIISISDTDTWDDTYLPGYAGSPGPHYRPSTRAVSGGLDAYAWTKKIGVLEATMPSLTSNDVRRQINYFGGSYAPATDIEDLWTGSALTATYFAAGAAYWANTNEIRSDLPPLPNNRIHSIKTISVDTGGQTRQVWDRQLYLMGKYGGFTNTVDRAADGTQQNPFYATDPGNASGPAVRSNSEWESAPGTGLPANYLRATSPDVLIAGLQKAFSGINSQSGTAAGGSLTSANLNYGTAGTYVSQFSAARWSGTVLYKSVSSVAGVLTVSPSALWDAGKLLTARCDATPPFATTCTDASLGTPNRNIVTTITSSSGVRSARNFTYANLAPDSNYQGALNIDPDTGAADNRGQQRVNYLRGYRADEALTVAPFRTRDSALGDIINSAPIYVGAPATGITDTAYQAFFAANSGRTTAVYVGANDGMLHAFNALTGSELFAYIPGFVSSYLSDLTSPAYPHDPFVDAIPTIQEAKVNGSFKTVLVSGAGGGAQGVFALDVTDPANFDPSDVLFEFTDSDDPDLGNVLFAPQIVKLRTGASTYGYFAAVTGYNNRRPVCKSPGNASLLTARGFSLSSTPVCSSDSQGDAYVSTDSANRGVLFLLSLDRTVGTPWVRNSNYYKFYFPAISPTARNGLGPVSALPSSSGDGTAAALYFGDLQGQLWRFNTVGVPSAWAPSLGSVGAAVPLFVASPSTNVYQPITARPELASGPYGSTLVIFGTGAYLGQTDLATPYGTQSEYVLIDGNGGTPITRSGDLQPRTATLSGTQVSVTGTAFTYSGGSSKKGWYIDFPSSASAGERMVNKAAVAPGLLTFTSLTLAGSVCGSGGGYVYQVNPVSGLPLAGSVGGYVSTVGIPGPPVIVDLTVTGGQLRPTGEQINKKTQTTLVSGTTGGIAGIGTPPATKAPPVGRVSWRELTNYNDRH